jgi:SAM-dependent methyltransferase
MRNSHHSDLDNPATTIIRKKYISKKPFMRNIYIEWYQLLKKHLPEKKNLMIELGSGPGFITEVIPGVISSDVLLLPFIDVMMNGLKLPFAQQSTDAVLMVDVFHHISDAGGFFIEIERVLKIGGRLVMIEPWITPWSHWVYNRFHHEALDMEDPDWSFPSSGPLSGANQALPWNVFQRDRLIFEDQFPDLKIVKTNPIMPLTYLLGGGFSHRASLPGFTYQLIRRLEKGLFDDDKAGMFCLIVLEKTK